MGYGHTYRIKKYFTDEQREIIVKELERCIFLTHRQCSFSSGSHYSDYPMTMEVVTLDNTLIHFRPNQLKPGSHELMPMSLMIELDRPITDSFIKIQTYRMPFDMIVQMTFIIIQNIAPDVFEYSSDGTVEDWKWSCNTLNRWLGTKYELQYLNEKFNDEPRTAAITEMLDSAEFSYIDGRRFINNAGDRYEVLTAEELNTECINHIANVVPAYLLEHFDIVSFHKSVIKRMYESSTTCLSPIGVGFATELDGTEYFIIHK